MNQKKQCIRIIQSFMDDWQADIFKLRLEASMAEANDQVSINREIESLELEVEDARSGISTLTGSGNATRYTL